MAPNDGKNNWCHFETTRLFDLLSNNMRLLNGLIHWSRLISILGGFLDFETSRLQNYEFSRLQDQNGQSQMDFVLGKWPKGLIFSHDSCLF